MNAFLSWVSQTPFSLFFGKVDWAIPSIQAVHIMAIAVVLFSGLWLDMRILGVIGRDQSFSAMARRFTPWIWGGILVLAATGLLLMIAEPTRAITSPLFQIKMVLLAVVALLTWLMADRARHHVQPWTAPEGRLLPKLLAVVSVLLWAGIVTTGRWIAYAP